MKFFVDSAETEEIQAAKRLGLADGVTTNPTIILKSGRGFETVIREIAALIDGPVAAEPVCSSADEIIREGRLIASWAENVSVKIPLTRDGLEAVRVLSGEGISTTMTLIFSPAQALLAAKAGASFICPFVGRLDDVSHSGMDLIAEIVALFSNYPGIDTEVIVASVRGPAHVIESAMAGADGVTVPYTVLEQLMRHPLTDAGIEKFLSDWNKIAP
ncbi:fructose-6-phosphate aldolase [bacterium]|nr:fructose-6-phosphate aldolase [bacterium]